MRRHAPSLVGRPFRAAVSRTPSTPMGGQAAAAARVGIAVAVLVALAAGATLLRSRRAPAPASPLIADSPPDSLAGQDNTALYRRANELINRGESRAALPILRRLIVSRPEVWQGHYSFAAALMNAGGESRVHRGVAGPLVRSSADRVLLQREALREIDIAESLTDNDRERAYVIALRAHVFANWGLAWNAATEYARAIELDPNSAEIGRDGRGLFALIRDGAGEPPAR